MTTPFDLVGTGATALPQLGFALLARGFWSGLVLRALAGLGWAGCCMPGLKAIADRLEGDAQSRAVSWHAAGVGIAGVASFAVAGALAVLGGPPAALPFGAACAAMAFAIGMAVMPRPAPRPAAAPAALPDVRPVPRNRTTMAWIAGYTVHSWELAALRAWGVTVLAGAGALHGAPAWLPGPSVPFTAAGLVGIGVSITGSEMAQRFGRPRVAAAAMGGAAALSLLASWSLLVSAPLEQTPNGPRHRKAEMARTNKILERSP